jgi:hypothetical protein
MSAEQRSQQSEAKDKDELSALLRALPTRDIDSPKADHLQTAARAAFIAAHQPSPTSPWAGLAAFYHRALEPALVATACAAYLGWACLVVLTLQP